MTTCCWPSRSSTNRPTRRPFAFDDHDQALMQLGRPRLHAEHFVQPHDRHVAVAEPEHFLMTADAVDAAGFSCSDSMIVISGTM
jgi:hypothetical protein